MVVDVGMAFVAALLIRLFSWHKYFKYFVVITACISMITCYFTNACQINFVGEMDLAIWIAFIIVFDIFLELLEDWNKFILKRAVNEHIKE